MKVLFLVIEFAPVNTTGNFRSLKFIKYLSQNGIEPVVVTMDEKELSARFNAKIDPSLLADIPEGTPIYRIASGVNVNVHRSKLKSFSEIYFSIVDKIAGEWEKGLMKELGKIMALHQPQAIYTSLPPFSCGALAARIAQQYSIPLVLDMRDLWAYWGSDPHSTFLHFYLRKRAERHIFRVASKIVAVTPQLINIFKKAHSFLPQEKFEYIPNGFDGTLSITRDAAKGPDKPKEFIIGYVGSFYFDPGAHKSKNLPWWKRKIHRQFHYSPVRENWLYRSPYFFFRTLKFLFQVQPGLKKFIKFHFVGREPSWLKGMLEEFELNEIYHPHGFVTHAESLRIQNSFDAFLTTSEKVENGEHYCLPSKIFDYVQKQKPILGFVTDGVQKQFLLESGLGIVCDPDDVHASAQQIIDLVSGKINISPDWNYLEQFHRRNAAIKLAAVLKSAVQSRQP